MRDGIAPKNPMMGKEAEAYVEKRLNVPMDTLLSFPKYILIETINTCNARCIMCGIDFDSKVKGTMSDELFSKIVDEIIPYKDHVVKVALYYDCEPLLDKKLPERIAQLKKAGVRVVNIATNGSALTKENARRIIEAGLNEIYITLDSLKKEVYEKIRVGLKFDMVYQNILTLIELRNELNPKLVIRIQMIQQELNKDEPEEFRRHWVPKLKANDKVVITKEHNWASKLETYSFGDEEDINRIPCITLWGTFCIHVSGVVGLCCGDNDSEVPLGNVSLQTIREVWGGEPLRKIREKHTSGRRHEIPICDGCTIWRDAKHVQKNEIT